MRESLLLLCLCGLLAGCSPPNRERLVKEVLASDPSFSSTLEKHREIANRIDTYKQELALKRSTSERAIAQLKKELAQATASVESKTAEAKKRLDPERERLTLALSMASEELRAQRLQRASLGRSIAKLKKVVSSAKDVWTKEERSRQDAQVQEMLGDAARLDREMITLNEHVRLLKIKLLLIKL